MELGLCVEMVFEELPFEERIARSAELGFKNVEMWFIDGCYKGTAKDLARLAEGAGVKITNTVIGSPDGSLGGGLTNPANRRGWLERARMSIEFNREAGIGATIVCTGNVVDGMSDDEMRKSVEDGLEQTLELADAAGVTLLLEPLNTHYDHAGYWLTSSDRGAEICRKMDSPRMRLLFDCYHMQIMEGDLVRHIERNIDVIGHFHSAGVPGRHELFNGETNYPMVLGKIHAMGYAGIFGLEYAPELPDAESLRKTRTYLDTYKDQR